MTTKTKRKFHFDVSVHARTQTEEAGTRYGLPTGTVGLASPKVIARSRSAQEATGNSNVMAALTKAFRANRSLLLEVNSLKADLADRDRTIANLQAELAKQAKEKKKANKLKVTITESSSGLAYIEHRYFDTKRIKDDEIQHRYDTTLFKANESKLLIKRIPKPVSSSSEPDQQQNDNAHENQDIDAAPVVYEAENPLMEVTIAKKLCTGEFKHFLTLREIVSDDSAHFLVWPYVRGGDLFGWIKAHMFDYKAIDLKSDRISVFKRCLRRLARQMCEGVLKFHESGYVHLDISTENVLWNEDLDHIHMIDFGAARHIRRVSGGAEIPFSAPSNSCHRPGKKTYRSPQIHDCKKFYGTKADVWSMAVVLFTLMVGYPPWGKPDCVDENFNTMFGKEIQGAEGGIGEDCKGKGDDDDPSIIYLDEPGDDTGDDSSVPSSSLPASENEIEVRETTKDRRSTKTKINVKLPPGKKGSGNGKKKQGKGGLGGGGGGGKIHLSLGCDGCLQNICDKKSHGGDGKNKKIRGGPRQSTIATILPQFSFFDATLIDLLDSMLCLDETQRYSMEQVLAHDWFSEERDVSSFGNYVGTNEEKARDTYTPREFGRIDDDVDTSDDGTVKGLDEDEESIRGLDESDSEPEPESDFDRYGMGGIVTERDRDITVSGSGVTVEIVYDDESDSR